MRRLMPVPVTKMVSYITRDTVGEKNEFVGIWSVDIDDGCPTSSCNNSMRKEFGVSFFLPTTEMAGIPVKLMTKIIHQSYIFNQ